MSALTATLLKPEQEKRALEAILKCAPNREVWLWAKERYITITEKAHERRRQAAA